MTNMFDAHMPELPASINARMWVIPDGTFYTAACTQCGWDTDSRNHPNWAEQAAAHGCGAPIPVRNYTLCADTTVTPERDIRSCVLAHGHTGAHQSGNGTIWMSPVVPVLCAATSRPVPVGGPDWSCVLDTGHAGHHTNRDGQHWHRNKA